MLSTTAEAYEAGACRPRAYATPPAPQLALLPELVFLIVQPFLGGDGRRRNAITGSGPERALPA